MRFLFLRVSSRCSSVSKLRNRSSKAVVSMWLSNAPVDLRWRYRQRLWFPTQTLLVAIRIELRCRAQSRELVRRA